MGDYLVLVPVRDLKWDDFIVDEHGPRRIIEMRRDHGRAYIEFSEGPSNWYLDNELFPCERLS